jgi:hypothetical protein
VIGPHELFHLVALAGMGCHWRFVSQFASGLEKHDPAWIVAPTVRAQVIGQ